LVLCFLAVFTAACYRYTSVRPGEIPVGANVRAHLSVDGEQRIRSVVGIAGKGLKDQQLHGHVLGTDQQGILLSVPWAERQNAAWYESRHLEQRIRVRQEEIREIELRELDGTKTTVYAVGGATAVAFLLVRTLAGRAGGTVPTTTPGPDERIAAVVLFTLPLGLAGGY
jgi:hypothetical protein